MRYTTGLKQFDEVNMLLKFLYLSEDNSVKFENSIGCVFELKMRDDGQLVRKSLSTPVQLEMTDNMDNMFLFAVIDQLKKQTAEVFPESFKNRWEEVRSLCQANLGFNYLIQNPINKPMPMNKEKNYD